MRMQYTGGAASVVSVLPTRELAVNRGDVVDVTDEEAAELAGHPDWHNVETLALPPGAQTTTTTTPTTANEKE